MPLEQLSTELREQSPFLISTHQRAAKVLSSGLMVGKRLCWNKALLLMEINPPKRKVLICPPKTSWLHIFAVQSTHEKCVLFQAIYSKKKKKEDTKSDSKTYQIMCVKKYQPSQTTKKFSLSVGIDEQIQKSLSKTVVARETFHLGFHSQMVLYYQQNLLFYLQWCHRKRS